MNDKIRYVNRIQVVKDNQEPGLMTIKAEGTADIRILSNPVLVPREYAEAPEDGIYELDFQLSPTEEQFTEIEMEVNVIFRIGKVPDWVRAVKINASDNADIEVV